MQENGRWGKRRWIVVAIVVVLAASCFSRQHAGDGWDFNAYYQGAERFLAGLSPYDPQAKTPFKYAPVSVLYFLPFTVFPFDAARWIFAALHLLVVLSCPLVVIKLLRRDPRAAAAVTPSAVCSALAVSLIGSLRFIDGEFHTSQVGLAVTLSLLVGAAMMTRANAMLPGRLAGVVVMGLGSILKLHGLVVFSLFARSWRSAMLVALCLAPLFVIPDPRLWMELAEHTRATYPLIAVSRETINHQGFYPLAVGYLGFAQLSAKPLLLWLPFFFLVWLGLPKWDVSRPVDRPAALLLSLLALALAGIVGSPLPWQHTYSLLWVVLFAAWLCASAPERAVLLAVSLFLGLSPKGIVGESAAFALESHQSVFLSAVLVVGLLVHQARRLSRGAVASSYPLSLAGVRGWLPGMSRGEVYP